MAFFVLTFSKFTAINLSKSVKSLLSTSMMETQQASKVFLGGGGWDIVIWRTDNRQTVAASSLAVKIYFFSPEPNLIKLLQL